MQYIVWIKRLNEATQQYYLEGYVEFKEPTTKEDCRNIDL